MSNTLGAPVVQTDAESLLVVEDDLPTCALVQSYLKREGRRIVTVHTGCDALRLLAEQEFSLVLLDLVLPDLDGRLVLERIREQPRTNWLPVFIMSVRKLHPLKIECMGLGADQYFEKPLDPDLLRTVVDGCLSRRLDLVRLARTDGLTGLPNRTAFGEAFERASALARRTHLPMSLAVIDLDHFKSINDTYGHEAGDLALQHTARHLTLRLRQTDVLGRWGGDELVVLMPGSTATSASEALSASLHSLTSQPLVLRDGRAVHVGFSAGVVDSIATMTTGDAVAEADRMLYRAKESGRTRVVHSRDAGAASARTVLFAEDEPTCAALIQHVLALEGYQTLHARDGKEALTLFRSRNPHLLLLDIQMTGMDGFEVLAALRRPPAPSRVPVIMLTTAGSEETIVRAFELGADDFVTKPFAPRALIARIRRLLVRR